MKAFVFKPSNALIGKLNVSSIDQIPDALVNFKDSHPLSAYDYVECFGKTWTLIDGADGLQLSEGRLHGSKVANFSGDSSGSQQSNIATRYKDAYVTASSISGVGGVIKGVGVAFGLLLALAEFVAGTQLGIFATFSVLLSGFLSGTIIYVIGVLISKQGSSGNLVRQIRG